MSGSMRSQICSSSSSWACSSEVVRTVLQGQTRVSSPRLHAVLPELLLQDCIDSWIWSLQSLHVPYMASLGFAHYMGMLLLYGRSLCRCRLLVTGSYCDTMLSMFLALQQAALDALISKPVHTPMTLPSSHMSAQV